MSINTNTKDSAVQMMPLNSLSLSDRHIHKHTHTHKVQLERIPDFSDGIIFPLLDQGSSYLSPSINSL